MDKVLAFEKKMYITLENAYNLKEDGRYVSFNSKQE